MKATGPTPWYTPGLLKPLVPQENPKLYVCYSSGNNSKRYRSELLSILISRPMLAGQQA